MLAATSAGTSTGGGGGVAAASMTAEKRPHQRQGAGASASPSCIIHIMHFAVAASIAYHRPRAVAADLPPLARPCRLAGRAGGVDASGLRRRSPNSALAAEARLAAKHPGLIKRSGNTLRIGRDSFTDTRIAATKTPTAPAGAPMRCTASRSASGSTIMNRAIICLSPARACRPTSATPPVSSPSGKRFFVL